ncbi:uncharacterized protein [Physcomitrium patens]|uniref:Uncharacterized protein n=1 Tax=Physcomitrium patens TaxID=3218 RepID=A0A2K1IHT0_PHYPA|nr:protein YIF1A-like [Physcomitrium patens]PNR28820.1 hypothetical protein PHYPA_027512 [Physcomitrium patens]|eukprot:XP_024362517.1 protein YIF1A-like [Physcomitrella patens]
MAWQPGPGFDPYGAQPGMQPVMQPGMQPGAQRSMPQAPVGPNNPLNDVFYGAGSGILGTYLGNSKDYVQSNVSRYLATHDIQYYFQVTDQYVKNKLKVVLCPFLHKGHWTRIAEQVAGGLKYKPPRHDINAPDLYLPLMAFATYIMLCGFTLGQMGNFKPDVMSGLVTKATLAWFLETILLKSLGWVLGTVDAPTLDIVAYGGYSFIGVSLSVFAHVFSTYAYHITWIYTSLCMASFLVRTMKRLLFAEARRYDRDSTRHHYLLLLIAAAQFPLFYWLVHVR